MCVFPTNVEEVQAIVGFCHEQKLGVTVQGGLTGLVGGGTATSSDEVLLCMDRMNQIERVSADEGAFSAALGGRCSASSVAHGC